MTPKNSTLDSTYIWFMAVNILWRDHFFQDPITLKVLSVIRPASIRHHSLASFKMAL